MHDLPRTTDEDYLQRRIDELRAEQANPRPPPTPAPPSLRLRVHTIIAAAARCCLNPGACGLPQDPPSGHRHLQEDDDGPQLEHT